MKDLVSVIKDDKTVTFGLLLCSLFYFFLFTNKLISLLCFLLTLLLSFLILKKCITIRKQNEDKLASFNFLYAFMSSIDQNKSAKESYEKASKYLVGHVEIKDFDSFIDQGLDLKADEEEKKLLEHLCQKEKDNEIHLLSYRESLSIIEGKSTSLKKKLDGLTSTLHRTQLALLFMLLILSLIINLSPIITAALSSDVYSFIAAIAVSFFYPSLLLEYYFGMKGAGR